MLHVLELKMLYLFFLPKTEKTTTNKFNMNSFLNFYSKKYPFVIGKKEQSGSIEYKIKKYSF